MKTEIQTNDFKSMLKVMDKIKNTTTDLIVDNDKVIKTNSETTIIYTLKSSWLQEEGKIVLPNETAELIKKLKENNFTLTNKEITTGKKKIAFTEQNLFNINTYENIDEIFKVTQRELLRMLQVDYAVARDEIRPILTGICFNQNQTCALDGFRMSVRTSDQYNNSINFVINGNSAAILKSILKDTDDIVKVYHDKESIVKFEIGNITLIAKCLEGDFINYKAIIPDEYDNKCELNPEEVLEEIEFIRTADKRNYIENIFTTDNKLILKGSQCREVYNEEKSLKLQSNKQTEYDHDYKTKYQKWVDKGKKSSEPKKKFAKFVKQYDLIPVNEIKSEVNIINELNKFVDGQFRIAFNPLYMSNALKQYKDKVEFRMTSNISPIVITNDGENLELILPVRLATK